MPRDDEFLRFAGLVTQHQAAIEKLTVEVERLKKVIELQAVKINPLFDPTALPPILPSARNRRA